jgi:arylsulfatase A-like enzyme
MISRRRELAIVVLILVLALPTLVAAGSSTGSKSEPRVGVAIPPPNIVLVLMADIGIDQWQLFGYGGKNPAATPNIAAIANGGIMFHNMWAMPACSNGRAALFSGRYPFRTNVLTAIGSDDLRTTW